MTDSQADKKVPSVQDRARVALRDVNMGADMVASLWGAGLTVQELLEHVVAISAVSPSRPLEAMPTDAEIKAICDWMAWPYAEPSMRKDASDLYHAIKNAAPQVPGNGCVQTGASTAPAVAAPDVVACKPDITGKPHYSEPRTLSAEQATIIWSEPRWNGREWYRVCSSNGVSVAEQRTAPSLAGTPHESPMAWAVFCDNHPLGYDYMVFPDDDRARSYAAGENIADDQVVPLYRASAFVVSPERLTAHDRAEEAARLVSITVGGSTHTLPAIEWIELARRNLSTPSSKSAKCASCEERKYLLAVQAQLRDRAEKAESRLASATESTTPDPHPDTEADGVVFCGKCGHSR